MMRLSFGAWGLCAFALISVAQAEVIDLVVDPRDRVVSAPGQPFHGKAYWLALSQCAGPYRSIFAEYADTAIAAGFAHDEAKKAKFAPLSLEMQAASNSFLSASNGFLAMDRGISRGEASRISTAMMYKTSSELKRKPDKARRDAAPCPAFYRLCQKAFPLICAGSVLPAK